MRVKEFDAQLEADPDYVWFTHNLFPRTMPAEGKRIEAVAKLLRLCRKSYNRNSGGPLEADPAPRPDPYPDAVITGVTAHHGEEANAGESTGDPT